MIKKFASNSIIYAGSAFLFSIGRQIVFFPILHKMSPELFVDISFLIILIDFLIYSMGASIADYYVKSVVKEDKKLGLYKFLFYFAFTSLSSILVFLFYDMSFMLSLILAIYLLFYTFNTLQMKLFFNNLKFSKNYIYIFFRLVPYFSLICYEYIIGINSLLLFVVLLLIFEIISYYLFKVELVDTYKELSQIEPLSDKGILSFIVIYLLFALVLRLDMFVVEYMFPKLFSEYYQMISVYMIFVNPIILITSASMLSVLTHVDIDVFIKNKFKILYTIIGISLSSGFLFQFFGEYVINFLYSGNKLINEYSYISFLVIFTTLSFQITKTFVIKYNSLNKIFFTNLIVILLPLIFMYNFIYFILSFFTIRAVVFIAQFLTIGKNK